MVGEAVCSGEGVTNTVKVGLTKVGSLVGLKPLTMLVRVGFGRGVIVATTVGVGVISLSLFADEKSDRAVVDVASVVGVALAIRIMVGVLLAVGKASRHLGAIKTGSSSISVDKVRPDTATG